MIAAAMVSRIAGRHSTSRLRAKPTAANRAVTRREQAQRLDLVDQVRHEEPEERDGRERDAQPEHSGGHGQR